MYNEKKVKIDTTETAKGKLKKICVLRKERGANVRFSYEIVAELIDNELKKEVKRHE